MLRIWSKTLRLLLIAVGQILQEGNGVHAAVTGENFHQLELELVPLFVEDDLLTGAVLNVGLLDEWMGCWDDEITNVMIAGSFPKIPCV